MGGVSSSLVPAAVMAIVCVGVDLAKNVFAIHGFDHIGSDRGNSMETAIPDQPTDRPRASFIRVRRFTRPHDRLSSRQSFPLAEVDATYQNKA